MSRHFLVYWKPDIAAYTIDEHGESLDHAASDQFQRIEIGDILWVVTAVEGYLYLIGRLQIGWRGDFQEAVRRLGRSDLWEADLHVIAQPGTEEPMAELYISDLASHLRFISAIGKDRLTLQNGLVSPQQLQTIRLLSEESVELLNSVWYGEEISQLDSHDFLEILEIDEDKSAYTEGGAPVEHTLQQRKRSKALIGRAKQRFFTRHGCFFCEVCGFSFSDTFGIKYIEAHHLKPLSEIKIEQLTSMDDLVMLCANCHRTIHSRKPPLTIDELKRLILQQKSSSRSRP